MTIQPVNQMKIRTIAFMPLIGMAVFCSPNAAQALSILTNPVSFTAQQAALAGTSPQLTFQNFSSALASANITGPATLEGVRWVIQSSAPASADGQVRINRASGAPNPTTPVPADITNTVEFSLTNITGSLTGVAGASTLSSLSCVVVSPATSCTNSLTGTQTKTYTIGSSLADFSTTVALSASQVSYFSTGTVTTSSYQSIFADVGNNVTVGFTPTVGSLGVTAQPFIAGSVRLEYFYSVPVPPGATVPGPLPLLGATAAFSWSRRLRKRLTVSN